MAKILVVEDEAILAKSIARSLGRAGYECSTATNAEEGLKVVEAEGPDVVLLDLRLEGMDGLQALKRIREMDPGIAIIVMTAYGSVETAVEAMKGGAFDYLSKPLDLEELKLVVAKALENVQLHRRLSYYQRREAERAKGLRIIGESRRIKAVLALVERIAKIDPRVAGDLPTVLILGETGTGKDLVARALHAWSPLADQPFVEVNCTTLPKGLMEAELFGYEKGAFTDAKVTKPGLVESADGGTLFLDEIGELSLEAQAKLLKVIEQKTVRRLGSLRERKVRVRIVAATNRDLELATKKGTFRQDLLYRLKVLTIELPPLRDREEDVILLAHHFLERFTQKYAMGPKRLSPAALARLKGYHWPGNVRELAHVIERAVLLSEQEEIEPDLLALGTNLSPQIPPGLPPREAFPLDGLRLEEVERSLIEKALTVTRGNVSAAARHLGIGREALRYRMQKYGIRLKAG